LRDWSCENGQAAAARAVRCAPQERRASASGGGMNAQRDLTADKTAQLHQRMIKFGSFLKQVVIGRLGGEFAIQDSRDAAEIIKTTVNELLLASRRVGVLYHENYVGCLVFVDLLKVCESK